MIVNFDHDSVKIVTDDGVAIVVYMVTGQGEAVVKVNGVTCGSISRMARDRTYR